MTGTMALVDGARVSFDRLRAERRSRLFEAMGARGLDALVLGRPANIAYASGARQLWTAGARPFGPGCVVVRDTGAVHLLSTWDEGVPAEIPHEHLYGLSWNPANIARSLGAIPGLAATRTVGTDSGTPGFDQLLAAIAPSAELVDACPALSAARTVKTADELACIETATAVAEAALTALVDALWAGISERELVGVYLAAIAGRDLPTPPTEGVACATPRRGPVRLRQLAGDRLVGPGELVVLNPGALYAGYEGGVGRTWIAEPSDGPTPAQRRLADRCGAALDALIARCRAGATGADLLAAWERTGEPLPPAPIAHGLGLGAEAPVIGAGVGAGAVLAAGSVLAVQAWVQEEGAGGFLEREVVVVGEDGPKVLSRYARGPSA